MMNPVPWLQMTNMISYQGLVRTFPSSVTIFTVPTVGLLGLCYDNNDQLTFINNSFKNISQSSRDGLTLPLLFSIKYKFPGSFDSKQIVVTQSFDLEFLQKEQS